MLTTLATVKAELALASTADDTFIDTLIAQASAAIESYCGRAFASAVQTQTFRLKCRQAALILDRLPVTAVASVVEDGETLTASDYEVRAEEGLLYRLVSDDLSVWSARKVVVTYTAGYASTPADVERACIDLVKLAYFARARDPNLRSEMVQDVGQRSWTAMPSVETCGGLPADIAGRLAGYRNWVLA